MNSSLRQIFTQSVLIAAISGCASTPIVEKDGLPTHPPLNLINTPDPVPKHEPYSRYGNPESYEVNGKRYYTLKSNEGFAEKGNASWYGTKFHGRLTSSGEPYDMYSITAAHKTLPIPSYARVKNLANGKEIIVRINDRGPFHDERILDLSYGAAVKLGVVGNGTVPIELQAISVAPEQNAKTTVSPKSNDKEAAVFIQIGAYQQAENANRVRERIQKASLMHAIEVAEIKKEYNTLYRVRIGPLRDQNEAESVASSLQSIGIEASQIVAE